MGVIFPKTHVLKDKCLNPVKVVICGGSFAGLGLIRQLLRLDPNGIKYEITLVDKNEYFEFICTNYEALVDPTRIKGLVIPYGTVIQSFRSEHVHFKQGKLIKV